MSISFEEKLCHILIKNRALASDEADTLLQEFKKQPKETFDAFLLSEDMVEKDDLLKALSEYYEVPSFDIIGHLCDHELLHEFPQDVLVRYGVLPLERDGDILIMVASNPNNEESITELSEYVTSDIKFYVGIRSDIVESILEYYEDSPFTTRDDDGDYEDEEENDLYDLDFNDEDDH